MFSLSPDGRENVFIAGVCCLILGSVMLFTHLLFRPVRPTQVEVNSPTPTVPSHVGSDPNPAWAIPQRHKKKVSNDSAPPVQKSAPPSVGWARPAPAPTERSQAASPPEKSGTPSLAQPTRLVLNGPSSITLPHSLLELQVEKIEVSSAGTKLYFRVTGSGVRGSQVCIEGPSSRGFNRKSFLVDGQGRLYKYLAEFGLQDCSELARGEVRYFAIVYEPLRLPTKTVLVSWSNPYSPSLNMPVLLRQY